MPLLIKKNLPLDGVLGIWQITEDERWFLEQLLLTEEEDKFIATFKGHRRLEWLASRWLLHVLSGRTDRGACLKDKFGKPFLENSPFEISISHSRELVSVIAAPSTVGIDIQKRVNKIERIAHKFMRAQETDSLHPSSALLHLHIYWGAKEALYKAYGRRELDFKAHIHISPFELDWELGECYGQIIKDSFQKKYHIRYELIETDYVLVYAIES